MPTVCTAGTSFSLQRNVVYFYSLRWYHLLEAVIIALALKLRDEIWAQVLEDLVKVKLPDWRDNAWVLGKLADNNLEDHLEENSFLDVKLLIHTFHFPLTLTYTTNSLSIIW